MNHLDTLITDHLDLWSAAVRPKSSAGRGSNSKLELTGIKKLRELILELAVRGKLVPQDPNDEPASVLLERIAAEKTRLVKEGKIKKPKALPEISEEDQPFELPEGWECIRLGDLTSKMGSGSTPRGGQSAYVSEGIPFLRSQNVWNEGLRLDDVVYIDENTHLKMEGTKVIPGDVLLNITGASLGRTLIFPDSIKEANVSQHVTIIRLLIDELAPFVHLGIKSPLVQDLIWGRQVGMAIEGLSKRTLELFEFPIPPLAEQQRIVAKVDELMTLCDQLELRSESRLAAHQTLVETLLGTLLQPAAAAEGSLTDSCDADECATTMDGGSVENAGAIFDQNWARLSTHFDTLFTTEASIDALKQTILQLAVMGKLVPQDPSDEPASALLARIAAEKARLVKEKKIKKEKPLPAISENEKPFELPQGWEFERIAVFGLVGTGATPSRSNPAYWEPAEINWVSSGETAELFVGKTKEQISNLAIKETNVSIYPVGTLIVAMYGQGKTRGQITELLEPAGTNQACAAIRLIDETKSHKDFVKLFFRKAYLELREHAAGGAQPNLNVGKIASTVIPLPPIDEQHRIVAKVDELMALCDQLKARLQTSQQTQLALAESLVEGALI